MPSSSEETDTAVVKTQVYAMVMSGLVVVGLVVNIGSIVLLSTKKKRTMFHTLLKVITEVFMSCVVRSFSYNRPGEKAIKSSAIKTFDSRGQRDTCRCIKCRRDLQCACM